MSGPQPLPTSKLRPIVVRRHLRPAQSERRATVLAVAAELADSGGYDAVAMKDVAERSGVALATLYRWFASKDHLLAEVLLDWVGSIDTDLRALPLPGDTPGARLEALMRAIAAVVSEFPGRLHAVITAVLSADPGVNDSRDHFHSAIVGVLDIALADADLADRETVIETLEHVMFSSLVHVSRDRESAEDLADRLVRVVRLVVP